MLTTDTRIDEVMNAAISFVEDADLPVTPDTQYDMLNAWSESFSGRQDDYAFQTNTAIIFAMLRLAPKLSTHIEF